MTQSQTDRPSQSPPAAAFAAATEGGEARPTLEPGGAAASGGGAQAMPTMPLPDGAGIAGVTAWITSKTFNALWSINQNRNSWVGITGVGWKRLSTASDSGVIALSLLSAHAREKNSPVNYREEADGMIHEMYVW